MTTEQLKNLLTDMADEVEPVSVHRQAAARSRRIANRRILVASLTSVAVLSGAVTGYAAIADGGDPAPPATTDGPAGTFYGATFEQGRGDALWSWQPGDEKPTEVIEPGTDDGRYYDTGAVSPDGRYIGYLTEPTGDRGEVRLRNLDTGDVTTLAEYSADGSTCSAPAWTPDSDRLFVDRGDDFDQRFGYVDVSSRKFEPLVDQQVGCSATITRYPEGDMVMSLRKEKGKVVIDQNFNREGVHGTLPIEEELEHTGQPYVRELTAISADGRYVCLNTDDVAAPIAGLDRLGICSTLYDLDADELIEMPIEGDDWFASASAFAAEDRFLVYTESGAKARLYRFDGTLATETATPWQDDEDFMPLGYLPR